MERVVTDARKMSRISWRRSTTSAHVVTAGEHMAVARRSDDANTYLDRVSTRRTMPLALDPFAPKPANDPELLGAIGISRTLAL